MMNGFEGHGWGMGWWWIIGLIIIVAVVLTLVKSMNTNSSSNPHSGKSALDILKERYARGEIDNEEYKKKKSDLVD